jgi:zinc transport system substrate-binding protein
METCSRLLRFPPVVVAVTLALVLGAVGCGGAEEGGDGGKVRVVASFYPLAEAADQGGGDCVDVENLTPAGAEPHDLELTTDQVDEIQDADVVLVMGNDFQPALEDAARQRRAGATVEMLDRLPDGDRDDPHVWLDPSRYARMVDVIAEEITAVAPSNCRDAIETRRAAYRAEVEALDTEFHDGLADCERDVIVTAHDAFGYLAARYGLAVHAIAGISPDQEPDADRIAELADLVRDEDVTTIFTEELVSPRVADALAREAGGIETETLNPLEGLTDEEIARGDDYLSVMRANLAKLRAALGCA